MSINQLKVLLALLLSLLGSVTATGQGSLNFGNRIAATIFVPVYDEDGITRLSGSRYSVQLFAGTNGQIFRAVGTPLPFRTGAGAGSWMMQQVVIPWANAGDIVTLQVRAWNNGGGVAFPVFPAARDAGAFIGVSPRFASLPLGGGSPPVEPSLIIRNPQSANNMQSFNIGQYLPCSEIPCLPWMPWFWNCVLQTNGSFVFNVSATQPDPFVVDSSTNLINWIPKLTNAGPATTVSYTGTNAAASSIQKFYRARTY